MSDQHSYKTHFDYRKLASIFLGLCACAASYGVFASETSEQFALIGQSDVFFDGGSGVLTGELNGIPYEIVQGFAVAQGDMVLGKVLPNGKVDVPAQTRGLGQDNIFDRWPDGVIPYQFTDAITEIQRERAVQAIAHWNARTKIKMILRTEANAPNYDNYISFELSGGCASYVGMTGGEQSVWLADNCTVGSIIHEIGHAIGLFHEHTRPDRDDYVTVHLNNVTSGKDINFDKIEFGASTYSDYDYGSIMHYGEYFFSSNGNRSISVPDGVIIGQRDALSENDIASINNMYATDLKLAISTEAKDTSTQIDLVVTNAGNLGAYDLKLTAKWGDNADWISISKGSGWDCQQFNAQLNCTRTSMREFSDSSFSIRANPTNVETDKLEIRVESRTLDVDLRNNAFNDTINSGTTPTDVEPTTPTEPPTPTDPVEPTTPVTPIEPTTPVETTDNPVPTQNPDEAVDNTTTDGSTNTDNTDNTSPPQTGAAQADSGGGGAVFYLLALLVSWGLKRRFEKLS